MTVFIRLLGFYSWGNASKQFLSFLILSIFHFLLAPSLNLLQKRLFDNVMQQLLSSLVVVNLLPMPQLSSQYERLSLDLRSGSIEDKDRLDAKEEKLADSSEKAV